MDEGELTRYRERIGLNVKHARIELRWGQEQLALESGLSRSHVSQIERGTLNVSVRNLLRLAKALRVPPGSLFDGINWD